MKIIRNENDLSISRRSSVSAVIFPLPTCPALLITDQKSTRTDDFTIEVKVSQFAPWQDKKNSSNLSNINFEASGFSVTEKKVGENKVYTIHVPDDAPENDFFIPFRVIA